MVPPEAPWIDGEISILESFEADPRGRKPRVRERYPDPPRVVLCLDTSRSMADEKMMALGVACAMVALNSTWARCAAVAFENESRVIKRFEDPATPKDLIGRLFNMPYRGYTHLEDGLRAALDQKDTRASVVLITDGLFTAGRDPQFLAPRLAPLHVVALGTEASGLQTCRRLASSGQGTFHHAPILAALPRVVYSLIRKLNRRST